MHAERSQALGDFLRSRRERLAPADVGLPEGRRRRTPGLRREEVAELSGIGIDWYVRLEQGRTVSPSLATIDALGRALRLSKPERAHLEALTSSGDRRAFVREVAPPSLVRMVHAMTQPAYVTGRRWDVVAWNEAAVDLFTDFGAMPEEDRNSLLFVVRDPRARALFGRGWAAEARRMVTQFRARHDLWAGDPAFRELLARLRAGNPQFDQWWETHDVASPRSGRKRIHHPTRGVEDYEHTGLHVSDDPSLKLVVYTRLRT